jgi:hypothetical protein
MQIQLIKEEISLLNEFYEYLRQYPKECILDTIQEFCFDKNIPVEEIGYLISQDSGLKQYTENNLKLYKFSKVENKSVEVW